ncbi:MAG: hypothetical protein HFH10_15845 [Dorea sp.]|nr:hypothetical protein [Dorea sp.]
MPKINVDLDYIKNGLTNIGYIISDIDVRENNGRNWQIKFSNSGAVVTIYDTNKPKNSVVNGKTTLEESEMLKTIVDRLKSKELTIDPLNKQIVDLIHSNKEDFYYDFKVIPHKDRESLLHDILCLSNNTENKDAFLILGVQDSTYEVVGVSSEEFKSNDIYDFLKAQKFAGNHMPEIKIKQMYYKYKIIGVIVCRSSKYVPFYLTERYHGINAYQIYTRVGDTNTPKNQYASYTDVEKLWRIHFKRENE